MKDVMDIIDILGNINLEAILFPVSRVYDIFVRKSGFVQDFHRQVAQEMTGEIKQGRVLDVGTGPGYLPIQIVSVSPNIEVLGIDASLDMVKLARGNAEKAGLSSRVKFEVVDANQMPFDDASFDMVVSTMSLHHWKKPVRIIDEIHRVLKDGGQAWVYDLGRDPGKEVLKKTRERYGCFVSMVLRFHAKFTLEDAQAILKSTKFKRCKIENEGRMVKLTLRK